MSTLSKLFEALREQYAEKPSLPNTKETWERIGKRDDFRELGFTSESEKEEFLKDWMKNNPYNNIR